MPAGNLLQYALVALVIALIAAFLGFGGIAGAAAGIAQILFYVFLVIFLVVLIMNFMGRSLNRTLETSMQRLKAAQVMNRGTGGRPATLGPARRKETMVYAVALNGP